MKNGVHRVLRGGSILSDSGFLRTTERGWDKPERRYWSFGFRIVIKRVKAQK